MPNPADLPWWIGRKGARTIYALSGASYDDDPLIGSGIQPREGKHRFLLRHRSLEPLTGQTRTSLSRPLRLKLDKIHSDIDETVMVMVEPATVEPIGSAY